MFRTRLRDVGLWSMVQLAYDPVEHRRGIEHAFVEKGGAIDAVGSAQLPGQAAGALDSVGDPRARFPR
jgi:hypothetical protein